MKPFAEWDTRLVLVVGAGSGLLAAFIFALVIRCLPPTSGIKLLVENLFQGSHIMPAPPPSAGPDPPIVVSGGSLNVHGNGAWTVVGTYASADVTNTSGKKLNPTQIYLDGVDPNGLNVPQDTGLINPDGNWSVVFSFRQSDGKTKDPSNLLSVCTSQSCQADTGPLNTTKLYLIPSPGKGTFYAKSIDRGGGGSTGKTDSIFYDLNTCGTSSPPPPHDACGHMLDASVDYFLNGTEVKKTYECVDGACSIGIDQK